MKYKVYQDSRVGRRSTNQDRLGWAKSSSAVLLAVADGMGGHRLGEVAAQIAIDQLTHAFNQEAKPRLDNPGLFLGRVLHLAHEAINDYAALRAIPIADAPRTTCVACVIQDGRAVWAHVGDSRFYFIREGRQFARTIDHSHVQNLLDAGEITPEQAAHHPQRNLVFTCLGGDMTPRIDVAVGPTLQRGDTLALCSDGLWAPLSDILPVGLSRPLERALPQLMDQAELLGGPNCDNLTLLAMRWESNDDEELAHDQTQPFRPSQTIIENLHPARTGHMELSDADIKLAIEQIRTTLKNKR